MCVFPKKIITPFGEEKIVRCGKCIECVLADSKTWAFRIMYESRCHEENCVVTLTYNEENVPPELNKRDYQLFLKSLREALYPRKVRYFLSAEYGSLGRPHYHIILFGWCPQDLYVWKKGKRGSQQFRSPFLETIWTKGFCTVGELTYDTAYYSAKYLQKLAFPVDDERRPPFVAMSTHPGIGAEAFTPQMLADDKCYYKGKYIKLPRYYEKLAVKRGFSLDKLRMEREENNARRVFDKKAIRARRLKYLHMFGILRKPFTRD